MKENDCENIGFGNPIKPKFRKVSSKYLSPTSNSSIVYDENQSPQNIVPKPRSSTDYKNHKSLEKSGLMGKLWPSSSSSSSSSMMDTFGNHLGNDRLKDLEERKNSKDRENSNSNFHPLFLSKQKSCMGFSRFENDNEITKEKRRSFFGGSMRYTGKMKFPGRFSINSSKSSNLCEGNNDQIAPGRFSVDANSLGRRCNSARIRSDILSDIANESESEYSDICSNNSFDSPVFGRNIVSPSYMAPTVSSRKAGIDVPSKYMQDSLSKSRRWSSDSSVQKPIQRATSSLNSKTSKWTLSPGRPNSPPVLMENKGIFTSNMKPPTSPSKGKKVGNFLSMGLELLKGKRFSSGAASPLKPGMTESVHHLRIVHNRLLQWRYVNARADSVHRNISKQAEANLVYALDGLIKLRQSVVQKKLQLQRQMLEMKLSFVLHSQIKLLEAWGSIEKQHSSAVSISVDCLQSAVCRVPLIEGATVEPQSVIIGLQRALDVSSSIKLILSNFSSGAEKTAEVIKEMAEVVVEEKLLLEECLELFKNISTLESQERNLICSIIQLRLQQEQYCKKEKEMGTGKYAIKPHIVTSNNSIHEVPSQSLESLGESGKLLMSTKNDNDLVKEQQVSPPSLNNKLSSEVPVFVPKSVIAKKNESRALASRFSPTHGYTTDSGEDSFDEDEEDNMLDICFDRVAREGDLSPRQQRSGSNKNKKKTHRRQHSWDGKVTEEFIPRHLPMRQAKHNHMTISIGSSRSNKPIKSDELSSVVG